VATVRVGHNPLAAAYAPDGRHAYVLNSNSGTVSVLDTATNRVTATIPTGDTPWCVALTRDGRRAYVTNAVSNTVTVLQTAS
jgi:YVTN family beta-propeller protein